MSDSITEDKRTEERIVRDSLILDTVLESLNHPFMVIDAEDHSVLLANSAARSSMSPEVKTCYGLSHGRRTPCDGSDHMCPLAEVKRTRNPVKVVHRHLDQEGNLRWVEVNAHPIFDERKRVVRVIEYCLDITERKRAEAALQEAHDELESRVKSRTVQLTKSNEQLKNEIKVHKQTQRALQKREAELNAQSHHLQEVNIALKVLLKQMKSDKEDLQENVLSNI
ncbi:MAG: PAS domain-containing protein, partial [Deltaproteobacteria bacterium]